MLFYVYYLTAHNRFVRLGLWSDSVACKYHLKWYIWIIWVNMADILLCIVSFWHHSFVNSGQIYKQLVTDINFFSTFQYYYFSNNRNYIWQLELIITHILSHLASAFPGRPTLPVYHSTNGNSLVICYNLILISVNNNIYA